jgi:hypothetical protein
MILFMKILLFLMGSEAAWHQAAWDCLRERRSGRNPEQLAVATIRVAPL